MCVCVLGWYLIKDLKCFNFNYFTKISNSTPRPIPKRIENISSHKNLYMNVHSNIIHKAKKWKQLKCPSTEQTKCGMPTQWNRIKP